MIDKDSYGLKNERNVQKTAQREGKQLEEF